TDVRLACLTGPGLCEFPEFDVLVSTIVLQHNPPPIAALMLDAALRKLRPGGVALFQVPTYGPRYRFVAEDYLAHLGEGMEMHVLPQHAIFEIFERTGCRLLECREDAAVGNHEGFVSNTFFVRKRGR
ncbi:MAG: hypothetical protein ACREFB_06960, partial [Stellaceae bacterium]